MAIINGTKLAERLRDELKAEIAGFERKPGLAAVLVGENPASKVYVGIKQKKCAEVGITSQLHKLPETITQEKLLNEIEKLNKDPNIDAILVQLPLPKHINERTVLNAIALDKDVDGFHPLNLGKLAAGEDAIIACTPHGVLKLIQSTGETIEGKHAVIIGRSTVVGLPAALLLLQNNATVSICHSRTQNLKDIVKQADIVVAAAGKPGMITKDMIKKGAIVIDVGTTKVDGKLKGDVAENAQEVAGFITPVPGGVGPMTVAMLLYNTVQLHKSHDNL